MRARLGAPKANTATAHKLARMFYYMWKNGVPYHDKGADYYKQTYKERVLRNLKKKARVLGYNVNLEPILKQEFTDTIARVVSWEKKKLMRRDNLNVKKVLVKFFTLSW